MSAWIEEFKEELLIASEEQARMNRAVSIVAACLASGRISVDKAAESGRIREELAAFAFDMLDELESEDLDRRFKPLGGDAS